MESDHLIDYSSFDETMHLEEILATKDFTLTKLFAILRTWNKTVHNHFAQLILLVSRY